MNLHIAFGIPKDQAVNAAEVLYHAFEDKFEKTFHSKEKVISLLSRSLRNDRTVVASYNGEVAGVGGLIFEGKEFMDVNLWQFLQEFKWEFFRFLFLGWVFKSSVRQNGLLVDMLGVAPTMQSKGVGSALMQFIIDFANLKGFDQINLYVMNTNTRARTFYKRLGFKERKSHTIFFPWSRIYEFDRLIEMVYCR